MSGAAETWLTGHEPQALKTLKRFCRIPSISADPAYAASVREAAGFVASLLYDAGFPEVSIEETGGSPAVLAEWGGLPDAPTVLVYGHYDVQPPDPLGAWTSPPFEPTVRDDRLYARGVSDDKGPLLIPILVAKAYRETGERPPVNLKFLVEGEEESGSPNFEPTVARLKDRLAADLVLSADGAMWRADLPSVTVASRGLLGLDVRLTGAAKDLHSGRHGGSAPNPVRALVAMLASLHDADGNVLVEGFADGATPPDPAILAAIRAARFDPAAYLAEIGAPVPEPLPTGEALLERQWLHPTLEFNGVSGGYAGAGSKTVIPAEASAKITCRLVAGQEPDAVFAAIRRHLEGATPPGYHLAVERHGPGSVAFALDPASRGLAIAEEVLTDVLGAKPLRVAMGATIPIGAVFKRHLGTDAVFFSFSTADEDYHAPNEFFRLASFRTGLKAWVRMLEKLAAEARPTARRPGGS
ncbi:M20/M25/M40 family metallo-hydrolase [Aureimonas leprariae]|uniref:M20 family dipeptidase n=1 Tax=Plantimonas leprariae TaxID=2615207 RepID=A0A7V7TUX8_9HYPH|nr:M20/M25/M40 family metallo-hydrolase [Aureimonas leprariae]KAB0676810.1 M20 family dipeptidase [Aureimonas leprariae]